MRIMVAPGVLYYGMSFSLKAKFAGMDFCEEQTTGSVMQPMRVAAQPVTIREYN